MGASDQYMLRDGITEGYGGFEAMAERKGSAHDPSSPLQLGEYLSYDEMALSALLLLSVPTHFINNGARANRGQLARDAGTLAHEKRGVLVGVVGARFERPGVMEAAHVLITPQQNTPGNGYGADDAKCTAAGASVAQRALLRVWARFYQEGFADEKTFFFSSYKEASTACAAEEQQLQSQMKDKDGEEGQGQRRRFVQLPNGDIFNCDVTPTHVNCSCATTRMTVHESLSARNSGAYVHVAGLGLGTWAVPAPTNYKRSCCCRYLPMRCVSILCHMLLTLILFGSHEQQPNALLHLKCWVSRTMGISNAHLTETRCGFIFRGAISRRSSAVNRQASCWSDRSPPMQTRIRQ